MRMIPWFLLVTCCRYGPPEPRDTGLFGTGGAGVIRVGPPAPTGGIYDLVVYPEGNTVFVSNQRVPFITVADATTGEWLDAIDLQQTGEQRFPDQRLYVIDGALHATNENSDAMLRFDASTLEVLDSIIPRAPMTAHDQWGDQLWVTIPEEVKCFDNAALNSSFTIDFHADAMSVDENTIAFLHKGTGELHLLTKEGTLLWEMDLDGDSYEGVLAIDGRIFVTDRTNGRVVAFEKGERIAEAEVGADAYSLVRYEDYVVAVARLGAELPASGAYQGAAARVVALNHSLEEQWSVETDKRTRYLDFDGDMLWTASEGAQRLLTIDPEKPAVVLEGPRLGMSIDHLERSGDRVFFPSHLTDELWWVDLSANTAESAEVCGWPSYVRKHEGDLWLLCQDQGELWRFEPGNVDLLEQREVAETFHAPCDTPFCEDAHIGMDVTVAFGDMVYSDPALPGVRWLDGRDPVVLGLEHVATESAQRMGLRQLGWEIVVHEPWTRSSWLVTNQGATQAPDWGSTRTTFPVVGGGELVWLGAKSVDTSHVSQIDLGQNISVVGVSERWIVAEHGWDVEVYDAGTLERLTLLSMSSLRAPPFVHTTSGEPGPMRYLVVEPELLVIGNTFRATLELRHLPTLAPIGTDEPLALGEWSHLDGIR